MKSISTFVFAAAIAASLSLVACSGDAAETTTTDSTATIDSAATATPEAPASTVADTVGSNAGMDTAVAGSDTVGANDTAAH